MYLTIVKASPKTVRSEEHTSELQSLTNLVCRLLLEKKKDLQPPSAQLAGNPMKPHTPEAVRPHHLEENLCDVTDNQNVKANSSTPLTSDSLKPRSP